MSTVWSSCSIFVLLFVSACGGADSSTHAKADAVVRTTKAPSSPKANTKTQAPRRKKRVRLDMVMIKALFGNYPSAPGDIVNELTADKIDLGRMLYHEKHLSKNGDVSCASCHELANYGQDGKRISPGTAGESGDRNTPTTWNAFRHFGQYWDYRAANVEEQAVMAVLDPTQHGLANEAEVVTKIKEKPELVEAFGKAFPGDDPVTATNLGLAIGAFERTLVTRSRWDEFLDGDSKALNNEEKLGLKTFLDVGCTTCHMSRLLGGSMPQKVGVFRPYPNQEDTGRHRHSGNEIEKYFFKVPSLLNVAKTAPYNHDGSVATLEESVKQMAKIQLSRDLTDEQTLSIVTFLEALTGELPKDIIAAGR